MEMIKHLVTQSFTPMWVWCTWKTTSALNLWQPNSREMKTEWDGGWAMLEKICRKFVLKYISFLVIHKQMCIFFLGTIPKAVSHLLSQFCHPGYIRADPFCWIPQELPYWAQLNQETTRLEISFQKTARFQLKASSQDGLATSSKESQQCLT